MSPIMPELHAIGIDLTPLPDLGERLFAAGITGIENKDGFDMVGLYVDPSGAKVAMGTTQGRVYIDAGLVSACDQVADVFRITDTLAHIDLIDDRGEIVTRFLAYVDDPTSYPYYSMDAVGEARRTRIRLSAMGAKITVFDDLDSYRVSQESTEQDLLWDLHLVAPWLFALYTGESTVADVKGIAMLAVECKSAELRTNQLTGQEFWYVIGNCGVTDIAVAVAADVTPAPAPENVIAGYFVMAVSDGVFESVVTQY